MKIACISDTHEQWHDLVIPECDLLISAGDYTYLGWPEKVQEFHEWLNKQPAKHIISCQGNHEKWVEKNWVEAARIAHQACPRIIFLAEGCRTLEGVKIYCSATTPQFYNWAWMMDRGEPIRKHWENIQLDTQILVTHGPAYGILDTSPLGIARENPEEHLGCPSLLDRIAKLDKLKLHVFGHIHGGSGETEINGVRYINAAICDEYYKPTNPVRVIEI